MSNSNGKAKTQTKKAKGKSSTKYALALSQPKEVQENSSSIVSLADTPRMGRPYKRLIKHSQQYDSNQVLLTQAATPLKLEALLRRIAQGELDVLCGLQIEMEAKWGRFRGICETRRDALLGLDWCIEPDQDLVDDAFANEVADFCEETLVNLGNEVLQDDSPFDRFLSHNASAIGPNIAVSEKIWEKGLLVDLSCVPYTRLKTNQFTNMGVAIRQDNDPLGFDVKSMPNKFVVFHRHWDGGFPFRRTHTHASLLLYLFVNLSQKDWLAYSELFGQPLRYGTAAPGATTPEDLETFKDLLEHLGSDTAALFPEGFDIKFLQSQGTGETYQRQLDYANTAIAILWLGQNLTTEVAQQGSRAAAEVHNSVRADLLKSDIKAEASMIRSQVLAPMVALKFPNQDAPVPYFVRKVERGRDVAGEQSSREKVKLAQELELEVKTDWLYAELGIPKPPVKLPETLKLARAVPAPVGGPGGPDDKGDPDGKKGLPVDPDNPNSARNGGPPSAD